MNLISRMKKLAVKSMTLGNFLFTFVIGQRFLSNQNECDIIEKYSFHIHFITFQSKIHNRLHCGKTIYTGIFCCVPVHDEFRIQFTKFNTKYG